MEIIIDPDKLAEIVQLDQARESASEEEQYSITECLVQAREQLLKPLGHDIMNPNFDEVDAAIKEKIIDVYGKDSAEYKALFGMRAHDF